MKEERKGLKKKKERKKEGLPKKGRISYKCNWKGIRRNDKGKISQSFHVLFTSYEKCSKKALLESHPTH